MSPLCVVDNACEKAQKLANEWHLTRLAETPDKKIAADALWLDCIVDKKTQQSCLAICSHQQGPVYIDFLNGKKAHRRQFGGGKGQPLVRAMGKLENGLPHIIDATAGMGSDSFVLASLGFDVTMVERSRYISALLADALERAGDQIDIDNELQQIIQRLSLHNADSAEFIEQQALCGKTIDVVYMDPMYPEKKKKAAAKKEMQLLQHLVGPDLDSEALLSSALRHARYRVVVKRPKGAPTLNNCFGIQPTTEIASPNTRYDIYSIDALKNKLS